MKKLLTLIFLALTADVVYAAENQKENNPSKLVTVEVYENNQKAFNGFNLLAELRLTQQLSQNSLSTKLTNAKKEQKFASKLCSFLESVRSDDRIREFGAASLTFNDKKLKELRSNLKKLSLKEKKSKEPSELNNPSEFQKNHPYLYSFGTKTKGIGTSPVATHSLSFLSGVALFWFGGKLGINPLGK